MSLRPPCGQTTPSQLASPSTNHVQLGQSIGPDFRSLPGSDQLTSPAGKPSSDGGGNRTRVAIVSYPQDELGVNLIGRFVRILSAAGLRVIALGDSKKAMEIDYLQI